MTARSFFGKSVFAREVLPQDLKLELARLMADLAIKAARYLAVALGRAHTSQMDEDDRRVWLPGERRRHAKPSRPARHEGGVPTRRERFAPDGWQGAPKYGIVVS